MILAHAGVWTAPNIIQSIAAGATFLLAIAAFFTLKASNTVADETKNLATETKNSVLLAQQELKQGEEQLRQSRLALQANFRPLIVGVPLGERASPMDTRNGGIMFTAFSNVDLTDGRVSIELPIRNIGSGPARLLTVTFEAHAAQEPGVFREQVIASGEASSAILVKPDRSSHYIEFRSAAIGHSDFTARVTYSDLAGDQNAETIFIVGWVDENVGWKLKDVDTRLATET